MRFANLALMLALSGCAAMKGADDTTTMRLSPRFDASAPLAKPSFAVASVRAKGLSGGQRYTYVDATAPGEVRQAATLFWEVAPTQVLADALVAGLRGRYTTVTGPEITFDADRRVVATLDRFEEISASGAAQAHVAFDVTQVSKGKILGAGRYCATQPIAGTTGSARADAFRRAVEQSVSAFVQDVASGSTPAVSC